MSRRNENKAKTDMTLNLNKIYEWGNYDNETLTDQTEEIPEVIERVKENKREVKEKKPHRGVMCDANCAFERRGYCTLEGIHIAPTGKNPASCMDFSNRRELDRYF
jgi:delta-aminolevulinic acid dehydratase/porphobilinogen synthase